MKNNNDKTMEEILRDTKHNKKANTVFLKLLAKQKKPKNPFDEIRSYTPQSMKETKQGVDSSDTN
jgi:hypothetical protein